MPVASYVAKFREEYQRHIDEGGCPFGGESSLAGVLAPVDQHHAPPARPDRSGRQSAPREPCPRARHGDRRRPGDPGPRGRAPGWSRRRARGRDRDPGLLLRAAARAAGRRVPHVPLRGRGPAEAPGRLHMTAQDGLVLRTAQTSEKAAEGQDAVLEFILLNHPLDCPDCDKGGECPLQDLTFRYGPGTTRMRFRSGRSTSRSRSRRRSRSTASAASSATAARASRRTSPRTSSSWRSTAARTRSSRRSRTSRTGRTSPAT